jgi:hypothetical protein
LTLERKFGPPTPFDGGPLFFSEFLKPLKGPEVEEEEAEEEEEEE